MHLLTRDYARGVIELAVAAGSLGTTIDLARCRPPHGATPPILNLTEARVEARAKRVGADSILRSCYKGLADFGKYTLQHRVERFAATPLTGPRPLTSAETGRAFLDDVSNGRPDIATAFETLRKTHRRKRISLDPTTFEVSTPTSDLKRVAAAEQALLALLTVVQRRRYTIDAKQWVSGGSDLGWIVPGEGAGKEVNAHRAKLWVVNRAIALGWTEKLFPRDQNFEERQGDRGRVERIGKKYQRIAMLELLARLADNNWLKPEWGIPAKVYDNPLDVESIRDVEPSILPADTETTPANGLPSIPLLRCLNLPANQREDWVFDVNLPPQRLSLALSSDLVQEEWLTLYRYASHHIDAPRGERSWEVPWQQSDFHFVAMFLIQPGTRKRFVQETEAHRDDFHEWLPGKVTDGPYIGELGRRDVWRSEPWSTLHARGNKTDRRYRVIKPTVAYHWESHLDQSLANGFARHVPIPWLITVLDLRPDTGNLGVYSGRDNVPLIVSGSGDRHSHVLIRRSALLSVAHRFNLEPVWTVIGERSALIDGSERQPGVRVRYNGVLWMDGDVQQMRYWSLPD